MIFLFDVPGLRALMDQGPTWFFENDGLLLTPGGRARSGALGSEYELINLGRDKSCRVEPLYCLLHPLSPASCLPRVFPLTPPPIEEAALLALAFITVA
jgi:hypothetical protein